MKRLILGLFMLALTTVIARAADNTVVRPGNEGRTRNDRSENRHWTNDSSEYRLKDHIHEVDYAETMGTGPSR